MKIAYLLKQNPDNTLRDIMEKHKESHEIITLDIRVNKDYDQIVDVIEQCDKIISW